MNMFQIFKQLIDKEEVGIFDEGIPIYRILPRLPWAEDDGLPLVKDDSWKEDDDLEPVNFENCGLISIDSNSITLWAGGDWQLYTVFKAVLGDDGKLHHLVDSVKQGCESISELSSEELSELKRGYNV